MKWTLMALAAVGSLTLSAALAQAPSPPTTSQDPSASQSSQDAQKTKSAGGPSAAISEQKPDQWLMSKFKGTGVMGADNAKIGDVSDLLFDKSGKVHALIVGVGGFLGIGSKEVALPMDAFQVMPGSEGKPDQLKLSMTKDQLQQAAEFKPLAPTTTGAGTTRPANRPAGSPTSPSAPGR